MFFFGSLSISNKQLKKSTVFKELRVVCLCGVCIDLGLDLGLDMGLDMGLGC